MKSRTHFPNGWDPASPEAFNRWQRELRAAADQAFRQQPNHAELQTRFEIISKSVNNGSSKNAIVSDPPERIVHSR
jgi:truncated hemoglobin YjbI